jgi:hypothetical protein
MTETAKKDCFYFLYEQLKENMGQISDKYCLMLSVKAIGLMLPAMKTNLSPTQYHGAIQKFLSFSESCLAKSTERSDSEFTNHLLANILSTFAVIVGLESKVASEIVRSTAVKSFRYLEPLRILLMHSPRH